MKEDEFNEPVKLLMGEADPAEFEKFKKEIEPLRAAIHSKCFYAFHSLDSKYRLMIAGSRGIDNIDISPYISDNVEVIISGGAKGVDAVAEKYADEHRLSKIILRPDYETFHRNAPLVRNREMVNMSDEILVFWDGKSRGTKYTIGYAKKVGKPVRIIKIEED